MGVEKGLQDIAVFINAVIEDSYEQIDSYTDQQLEGFILTLNNSVREISKFNTTIEKYKHSMQETSENAVKSITNAETELNKFKEENKILSERYTELLADSSGSSSTIADLKAKIVELETTINDSSKDIKLGEAYNRIKILKEQLEIERSKPDFSDEVNNLRDEIKGYQERISQLENNSDIRLTAEFQDNMETLKQRLQDSDSQIKDRDKVIGNLTKEILLLKNSPKAISEELELSRNQIKQLTAQLNAAGKKEAVLPIIDNSTILNATTLIVIREIKPFSYMNYLVNYLATTFLSENTSRKKKEAFVLVLDPLNDEHRIKDYTQFGFNINCAPKTDGKLIEKAPMVVTSYDATGIRNLTDLSEYNILFIVDRYCKDKEAVKRKSAKVFYTIDRDSDRTTYDLSASECIATGKEPTSGRKCKYYFNPNDFDNSSYDAKSLTALMSNTDFVKGEILCNLQGI